jgi:hypothetical protein
VFMWLVVISFIGLGQPPRPTTEVLMSLNSN